MKSSVIKRTVMVGGHKTSISLEDEFWSGLKEIAQAQGASLAQILAEIDTTRQQKNLSWLRFRPLYNHRKLHQGYFLLNDAPYPGHDLGLMFHHDHLNKCHCMWEVWTAAVLAPPAPVEEKDFHAG